MPADLTAAAYLADGVDLAATGVELTHDGSGLWAGLAEGISVTTFPGANGGLIGGGVFAPYTLSTMYTVKAAGTTAVDAALKALRRRCKPGRTVTLSRSMPDPDGTDANTTHTATARRVTDRVEWIAPSAAVIDIDWLVVSGPWVGPTDTLAGPATVTAKGDIPTQIMTITLAAGGARTITNNANQFYMQFLATVPAGGVLIDVAARTAHAITGGADMSGSLQWGKEALMQLEPGSNALVTDAGTFSIDYQPAYL